MQARVKQDARYGIILAFSGVEFVKIEWREVPVGKEAEALRNQYLEVREPVVVIPIRKRAEPKMVETPEQVFPGMGSVIPASTPAPMKSVTSPKTGKGTSHEHKRIRPA